MMLSHCFNVSIFICGIEHLDLGYFCDIEPFSVVF